MLAIVLNLSLLLEAALYTLGCVLLLRYTDGEPAAVIMLALTVAVLLRISIVALLFLVSWIHRARRPPEMRISALRAVRLCVVELAVFFIFYTILMPLERWLGLRGCKREAAQPKLPVLFVHGYFCNGGYWWPMIRYLRRRGVAKLCTMNLEPLADDIDRYADRVAERIEQICRKTGAKQVILVGHSMGGLVARAYRYRFADKGRIAKLITLGTPHRGTQLALFSPAPQARQMIPGSDWLTALRQAERGMAPVPITSIYSYHDDLIAPQDSARLSCAKNIALAGIGHMELAFSHRCQALVYQEIMDLEVVAAVPSDLVEA